MNRLVEFFLEEQWIRWKIYLISCVVAFIYALVNLFGFQRPEGRVGVEIIVVLLVSVVIQVAVYIGKDSATSLAETQQPRIRLLFSPQLGIGGLIAIAVFFLMYRANIPELQAQIAGFRLKSLVQFLDTIQAADLSDDQIRNRYQRIGSIVDKSSKEEIPLDTKVLQSTQSAIQLSLKEPSLSNQTRQLGLTTSIDVESLSNNRMIQTGAIVPIRADSIAPRQIANRGYMIASPVSWEGKNLYLRGEHSVLFLAPGDGYFFLMNSKIVFDSLDFEGSGASAAIISVNSDIFVHDSILQNVGQLLDGITWADVRFESSQLSYAGGPLRLRNVTFKDCVLSPPPLGTIPQQLIDRITEAKDQPITFVYEPPTEPKPQDQLVSPRN